MTATSWSKAMSDVCDVIDPLTQKCITFHSVSERHELPSHVRDVDVGQVKAISSCHSFEMLL